MAQAPMERDWQYGVFGCFENCGLCIYAFFCPCIVFGRDAEMLGESCFICGVCYLLEPFGYAAAVALRGRLRERRGIAGSLGLDMMWIACCPFCALVQEAAEVREMMTEGGQTMSRT